MARNRTIQAHLPGGSAGRFTTGPNDDPSGDVLIREDYCSDHPGPGDGAPLYISHLEKRGGIINRPWTGFFASWFTNYTNDWLRGLSVNHLSTDTMDIYEAAAACAARTNPSRPYVDVSVNVGELRDLSSLVRRLGGSPIRRAADLNLRYQFGIRPLVNDLVKLLDFQGQVNNRVQEIERLRTRGLRRTISLDSASNVSHYEVVAQSLYDLQFANITQVTTEIVRGHARWSPDRSFDEVYAQNDIRAIARQAVLGMEIDISTAWNLLPWSWLADWCSNMGDVLSASRNIVGQSLDGVAIMRHTTSILTSPDYGPDGGGLSRSNMYVKWEEKRRSIGPVVLSASLPFLSNRQLGIIASIGLTRR